VASRISSTPVNQVTAAVALVERVATPMPTAGTAMPTNETRYSPARASPRVAGLAMAPTAPTADLNSTQAPVLATLLEKIRWLLAGRCRVGPVHAQVPGDEHSGQVGR
jgi:hypothetical protein